MTDDDAQYTTATQVVDDRMRTDVLGPKVLEVIKDHKPVNDHIQAIVADAVEKHPEVRSKLKDFVDNHHTSKRGVTFDKILWIVGTAVVTVLVGWAALHLLGYHK